MPTPKTKLLTPQRVHNPEDINTMKTINRTTYLQSLAIAVLTTLVVTTIANWFLFANIHADARANVVSDIQIVKDSTSKN